jgi:TolB-like protein
MSLLSELQRRNVFRVAIAYLAAAWLLVEVTDTIFPYFNLGETAVRILIILLAIGFPLFLVFSWVFEITPQGLKREKDVRREEPLLRKTGKKLDRAIIVLLVLAVGYFAVDKFVFEPARLADIVETTARQARSEALVESYGDQSIAVLPFVNLSADPEQEYFSDGISEELLNLLAQIPELRVPARTSSFYFKGKDTTVREIAEELEVAHILEGSVRKAGSRLRITAQLIEARSDTHLWSATYDRDLEDIFAIQDEISAAIVGALKERLGLAVETAPRSIVASSSDAYVAYLRARELVHKRNRDVMDEAIRLLEHALRLDESFAPAHAQLAIATMMLSGVRNDEKVRRAVPHLDLAQQLEPDLAEAHGGRALVAYMTGDREAVIEHADRALAVNPNYVDAIHWKRMVIGRLGRYAEGNALLQEMLAIDPMSVSARSDQALWLASQGRIQEAHAVADRILEQSRFAGYRVHGMISQLSEGKIAESLFWDMQANSDEYGAMWAFLWVGEFEEARRFSQYDFIWADILAGNGEAAIQAARETGYAGAQADALYYAGRIGDALPFYERLLERVPEGRPVPTWWELTGTMRLAHARRIVGDEKGAQAAAEIVRRDHAARQAAGEQNLVQDLSEAMLAAFEQDTDHAIAALESAIRRGFVFLVYIDDPVFDGIRDDPRFIVLRREMEERLASEHEGVLQMICFDNPVPDQWQPLPETCEGVEEQ